MNAHRRLVIAMGAGAFAPAALLAPRISFAQTPAKIWRIGFLSQRHLEFNDADGYYGPFTQGMRELGYIEGRNLKMEWRSAEGKVERLPALAADLVRLKVDVLGHRRHTAGAGGATGHQRHPDRDADPG